ncbi:MAG TPA: polysulfide reductase NrfD [Thermodesulfobacteriota bacterium]|nr:polysulfide reductase NrfD [Thermodesulfobacteriota bacterium]HNU71078.1 polysulfide reductase NrfD [Thermodesulfobacteriota bacterium]
MKKIRDMTTQRYGFVIDQRRCIGCHACTVACKTENRVPLGVNRTWVKYVEKGTFPHARRLFLVMRCNHCENPPCVAICPVGAMYQRSDGIVDFDSNRCLGCKSCMQACPYDAIYVDPERYTVAKCNYCAHRIEAELEPACVLVCPEHAIVAGDLNQSESEISRLASRQSVRVRKPEQGTRPKVYYIEADESVMNPTAARHEAFYMWSERNTSVNGGEAAFLDTGPFLQKNTLAAYDVSHGRPWGWQVPTLFWLKSLGSGLFAVPAVGLTFGWLQYSRLLNLTLAFFALLLIAATTVMLVFDLSRKERFYQIVLHPSRKSWLTRGAFGLALYSVFIGLFLATNYTGFPLFSDMLMWPTVLAGFFAAAYTGFLFGQCEGCDLWQTPLLPLHYIIQAVLAGGALIVLFPASLGVTPHLYAIGRIVVIMSLLIHLMILLGEVAILHPTDNARYAAYLITHGPYRALFWIGAVGLGGIVPTVLIITGAGVVWAAGASVLVLAGLFAYDWCFIMAGQRVPNS